jgi:hypothetical protein
VTVTFSVFGIGLSRTGTTSLTRALETLGYRAKHFPHIEHDILQGNYLLPSAAVYEALTDLPIVPIFAQLADAHPESRFVLTVRDVSEWLDACERYFDWQDRCITNPRVQRSLTFHRLYAYGCRKYHRERWRYVYETHLRNVTTFFRACPRRLLVMNIPGGDGWGSLCAFLGRGVPSLAFPRENTFEMAQAQFSPAHRPTVG